jgi:hypothetical protein
VNHPDPSPERLDAKYAPENARPRTRERLPVGGFVRKAPHRLEPPRCPDQQRGDESVATQEPQGARRRAERRRAAHTTRGPGEVVGTALSCRGRASPERAWPHGCSRAAQPRAGRPAARPVSARPVSALPIIAAASRHGGRAWSLTATGRSVGASSFGTAPTTSAWQQTAAPGMARHDDDQRRR